MEKIKFVKDDTIYEFPEPFTKVKDGVIKLTFQETVPDDDILLSGFNLLNEHNGLVMDNGEYLAFTTKYCDTVDTTAYISTGEVYVEPEVPDVPETPEPEVPELTEEEKAELKRQEFIATKESKINEMKQFCAWNIDNGVFIDGKQYSFTTDDQNNISTAMTLAQKTGLEAPYHANGESCALYSYTQLAQIYMLGQMNITRNQTYFNQLKLYIQSVANEDMIDSIKAITYGDELTGEYLKKYNEIMEQSDIIMQKFVELSSITIDSVKDGSEDSSDNKSDSTGKDSEDKTSEVK